MKNLNLTVIAVIFLWINFVSAKTIRTEHALKKATVHVKPTKGPKNVLDAFKSLPQDDLEFIKQLDKQFNKFGNNVKIKVQKVNQTAAAASASSKNVKRTIDGSLGYGYQQNTNDQQSMYTFSKPRYEFYPYSQHDIPAAPGYQHQQQQLHYLRHYPMALVNSDPHYYNQQAHTSVEIQPSQSYEIKPTDHGYKTIYHGGGGGGVAHNEHISPGYNTHEDISTGDQHTPVIVLRIPGPAKYAAHLQALLQQYIEARAAQYLQELQEQEAHGIDTSQQIDHGHGQLHTQAHSHGHTHDSYLGSYGGLPVLPYAPQQAFVPSHQMYIQPVVQMQPYFAQHSLQQNPYANAHIAQAIDVGDDHSSHSVEEQSPQHGGVIHPSAYAYQNYHQGPHSAQPLQQHQEYHNEHDSNDEIVYGHQDSVTPHNGLLTNENYPDDKHTRVIFQSSTEPSTYDGGHYDAEQHEQPHPNAYLPTSPVDTYRAPLVYHKMEQYYNNPHDGQSDTELGYDENAQSITTPYANTVAITPRPDVIPHNYHADYPTNQLPNYDENDGGHGYEQSVPTEQQLTEPSADYVYKRSSNKKRRRQSSKNRDEQYKKFSNLANRMKSRTSTTERATSIHVE